MVNSFWIIGSLLVYNFISFWGVAPCNLVDYTRVLIEYVTWAVRNSEMCFDVCVIPMWLKLSHFNIPQKLCANKKHLKKYNHGS
jgi:hypothetical protein